MNFNHAFINARDAHITFIDNPNLKNAKYEYLSPYNYNYNRYKSFCKYLSLLHTPFPIDLLNIMPKLFTITTNNNIPYNFNIDLLKDTSESISNLLNENPNCRQYHLDIDDNQNVLEKFSKIYQGEEVSINESERPTFNQIINLLEMNKSINIYNYSSNYSKKTMKFGMDFSLFIKYIKFGAPQTFIIKTKKKEYNCNIFGVYSSKILSSLLEKDPTIDNYYYDYDDELDEFQLVCDIFNFKEVQVSSSNMNSLNEIIKDFKITLFEENISKFVDEYDTISKEIDDDQTIVDLIEEIFSWLYQIKLLSVEKVKNYIIESDWIKTTENVQELVAFLLQVINNDSTFHPYIFELIMQLDKEANETNSLNILIPFLISKLMFSFGNSLLNCSFVYLLFKNGLIQKEELNKYFINFFLCKEQKKEKKFDYQIYNSEYSNQKINLQQDKKSNLIAWFYPELIEITEIKNMIVIDSNTNSPNISPTSFNIINKYLPDNIEDYKKMRNSGEPDDELTKALRNDDVDTLQSIIIKTDLLSENKIDNTRKYYQSSNPNQKKLSSAIVPPNLFEKFVPNGSTNYINYACAYGSLKCFKYLLLNHEIVTESTFDLAVFGGNIEIIKIVSQNIPNNNNNNSDHFHMFSHYYNNDNDCETKFPAIIKHQNDIFDWIFQTKYKNKQINDDEIYKLLISSVKNGNAHALIEIIDERHNTVNEFSEIIQTASKNGFCHFTKLLINFIKSNKRLTFLNYSSSVYFGNLAIFKLYDEFKKCKYDYKSVLSVSIRFNYTNIVQYFFQKFSEDEFKITRDIITECLESAIVSNNTNLFNYLLEQFKNINPNFFGTLKNRINLLSLSCSVGNIEIDKILTNLILKEDSKSDFTIPFFNAAILNNYEICKYFIDEKLMINYEVLAYQVKKLSLINKQIFALIFENADGESKEIFRNTYIQHAITNNNVELVKYLIENGAKYDNYISIALNFHNIDIIKLIFEKNPSCINKRSSNGTVLYNAVKGNNLQLVKYLLKIPGIDPGIFENDNNTPLTLSVNNLQMDIFNEIMDFYDVNIQEDMRQFNIALECCLRLLSINKKGYTPFLNQCYFETFDNVEREQKNEYNRDDRIIMILKRLLKIKTIDPNCIINNYTILSFACEKNEIEIVQLLLLLDKIDVNFTSLYDGNTPLITSINNGNLEIAELLIKFPKTNINIQNYKEQTALTISVSKNLDHIVELLINNEKFDPVKSCINYAFYNSSEVISKLLISSKNLDVNYETDEEVHKKKDDIDTFREFQIERLLYFVPMEKRLYTTTLLNSVNSNYPEKIDLIINHPSFDREKSQIKKSIFLSAEKNRLQIFQKLIKLENDDVNLLDSNNKSLLFIAVKNKSLDIISEILKNSKFDANKSCILDAFMETIINNNNESMNIINKLYNYDKENDHLIDFTKLLPNGKSFFTSIASTNLFDNEEDGCDDIDYVGKIDLINVGEIASFLIEHGVDPNKPDNEDFFPFEYAILLNSLDFVNVLINSNKVDYSQKVKTKLNYFRLYENQYNYTINFSDAKWMTYLQLAARSSNSEILKEFINKKLNDINSTNDVGENALFEACRVSNFKNVEILAEIDDIDYRHLNNEGIDIYKMVLSAAEYDKKLPEINTKEDYFKALIILLKYYRFSYDNIGGEKYKEEEEEEDINDEKNHEEEDSYEEDDFY